MKYQAPLQLIQNPLTEKHRLKLYVKREDMIHAHLSGNKWRKLKYNLSEAAGLQKKILLTFGGAYSNHIYAVAAAGKEYGFQTIGIIRGEKILPLNPTLTFAESCGMKLIFVSREVYSRKVIPDLPGINMEEVYVIPEGGTNLLALKGCAEIISDISIEYDYITTPCGTGGTLTGLIASLKGNTKAIGFSSLKGGEFLTDEVSRMLKEYSGKTYSNWMIMTDYHFGGYAKTNPDLINFIIEFEENHHIPLEQVYTGKMMYGIFDLIRKGFFENGKTIVALHTGGLQGRDF